MVMLGVQLAGVFSMATFVAGAESAEVQIKAGGAQNGRKAGERD